MRGLAPFVLKWCLTPFLVLSTAHAAPPALDFSDDFEAHAAGQLPGAPWKEETYKSGAVIEVDDQRAFSGKQAMHVLTPRGAQYRRGYVAIHLHAPLPQLQAAMYGRVMVWLDDAPEGVSLKSHDGQRLVSPGPPPVHWTLLQGEGRSADDRFNSIYRLGLEDQGGLQLMANFETTPPVSTDCRQQSALTLPVRRWACVEWNMAVATHEMQFWIDGQPITHVVGRAQAADACRGKDLGGQWLAPPRFDSLYMGFERYGDSLNDQNLWLDDVALARQRVGCPARK